MDYAQSPPPHLHYLPNLTGYQVVGVSAEESMGGVTAPTTSAGVGGYDGEMNYPQQQQDAGYNPQMMDFGLLPVSVPENLDAGTPVVHRQQHQQLQQQLQQQSLHALRGMDASMYPPVDMVSQMNQVQQIPTPQSQARSLSPPTSTTTDENDRDLTPGQRRRKEQNRAAQRAFRDRKERHLRTLESRLAALESTNTSISTENASLKAALEKARLENRILHETRSSPSSSSSQSRQAEELDLVHGPLGFMPLDHQPQNQTQAPTPEKDADEGTDDFECPPPQSFTREIFRAHPNRGSLHRITTSPATGERLLAAGAAWEMIICHPLYVQGKVDIVAVGERLKEVARCDGQGPVFEERDVLEAVQAARRGEGLVEEDDEEMW